MDDEPIRREVAVRRFREMLAMLFLCALVAAGLGVWGAAPTWSELGWGLALLVSTTVLPMPLFLAGEVAVNRRRPVIAAALLASPVGIGELLRLAVVSWASAQAVEAAWIGLWTITLTWALGEPMLLNALLTGSAEPRQFRQPAGWDSGPLSPRNVFATLATISREVGLCLLVAWSPWLVLATFAALSASGWLLTSGTGRKRLIDALGGYVALAAGVALWLM
ncbi:hypothetical protein AB0L65_48865 [Nonomuraea sp. NPDC052116]|uniref:hypothetical protein n=1 Tax=Nonomuraea sp. NPDC052116 TaxID=3155665 RepID=UPI00343B36ED